VAVDQRGQSGELHSDTGEPTASAASNIPRMSMVRYSVMALCALVFLHHAVSAVRYQFSDRWVSYDTLVAQLTPRNDVATAIDYLQHLRNGDYEEFADPPSPDVRAHMGPPFFEEMRQESPREEPTDIKPIGSHIFNHGRGGASPRTVSVSLLYRFPSCWVSGEVVTYTDGDEKIVKGVHVKRWSNSPREATRATLGNADAKQWLMLVLAIAIPIFMLVTALICVRTVRSTKSLWSWIPFILSLTSEEPTRQHASRRPRGEGTTG
jgi:hypothetical protein